MLFDYLQATEEERLWILYLNGCTQNIITTFILFKHFPDIRIADPDEMSKFVGDNWYKLQWDMDRRYTKAKLGDMVKNYKELTQGNQITYFYKFFNNDKESNFNRIFS